MVVHGNGSQMPSAYGWRISRPFLPGRVGCGCSRRAPGGRRQSTAVHPGGGAKAGEIRGSEGVYVGSTWIRDVNKCEQTRMKLYVDLPRTSGEIHSSDPSSLAR